MYYVNKIVSWVLSPIGLLFIGLVVAAFLRWRVRGAFAAFAHKAGAALAVACLVLFWILGCSFTTRFIGVPLEGEEAPPAESIDLGGVDAIVLLGGGMGRHTKCGRSEITMCADRVWETAKLWKAHRRPSMKIVVSGQGARESTVPLLKDLGVSEDDLLFVPKARNTEEEARMLASSGIRRVCLVTSAWHMPRARMLFERAGLEVRTAPADYEMHFAQENPIEIGDFFPSAGALLLNSLAVKEWVARFLYALKG